jgi:general secretion pathway protein C
MIMCDIMVSRILALLIWAAVAASVAFWGLRWFSKPMAVPPGTGSVALNATPRGDLTKLLSPPAAATDAAQADAEQASGLAARIQLIGVLAPREGEQGPGVALLVVDGKPAQAFKLGHVVDGDQVIQSISQQGVQIGPQGGATGVNLSLPLLPPPATGTLPSVSSHTAPAIHAGARPMGGIRPPPGAPGTLVPGGQIPDGAMDNNSAESPNGVNAAGGRRLPPRLRRQQLQQQQQNGIGAPADAPPPV